MRLCGSRPQGARSRHVTVEGHRQFNPGWHLALDLRNMLLVSECVARAALVRQESRGGHTREDFPVMDPSGDSTTWSAVDDHGRSASRDRAARADDAARPARAVRP